MSEGVCYHYDDISEEYKLPPVCEQCLEYDRALDNAIRDLRTSLMRAEIEKDSIRDSRAARARERAAQKRSTP